MIVSDPTIPRLGARRSSPGERSAAGGNSLGPDSGDPLRPSEGSSRGPSEQQAAHLRDSAAAMFMFASLGNVLPDLDVTSYRLYRDRLLTQYGEPTDPIVIMLVEQLALAHLNCGQLFYKASSANSVECASAYLAATTRLMAEFRRTALALPAYREAARRIEQGAGSTDTCPEKSTRDIELQEADDCHDSQGPIQLTGATGSVKSIARTPRKAAAGHAG